MTICPAPGCGVSFRVWRENELVYRERCHQHRETPTPPADSKAVARLRRSWASVDTLRLQPIPRADLRQDDRVEHLRERQEASLPWRSEVPIYDEQTEGEDALLLALNLPTVAEAA